MQLRNPRAKALILAGVLVVAGAHTARAQDRLCDPGNEDCRAILINYIRNETAAIDVAFWFMEDARYTTEIIARWRAGVPVRVLMDPRANASYPLNPQRLNELHNAGIPMRKRLTSYILHWKMMLFHAQNVVQFSGANYSADAWRPATPTPYENYVDESIYFTSDPAIVNSFRTKFDDQWVDPTAWANYANVTGPLSRRYAIFAKDPELNFPPWENFRTRSLHAYNAESRKIDVLMYRITDRQHADSMLAAVSRGVPVRLITEPEQYRLVSRMWHAWNVDRLYMGGVQIRHRGHLGLTHQKSVILYDQDGTVPADQSMVIFGSSNWTSPSAGGQVEHNLFTTRPYIASWFISQFERKWNNAAAMVETVDFVPLPPNAPVNPAPKVGATNVATTGVRLTWNGGPWAHLYDLYLDSNPNPTTLIATNLAEGPSKTATSTFSYTLPVPLQTGRTYYWRVVGKTMALQARPSEVWSFTTGGPGLLWHHRIDGRITTWQMNGTNLAAGVSVGPGQVSDTSWQPVGVGDLDGDGHSDVVWQNVADGRISAWFLNGLALRSGIVFSQVTDIQWRIRAVGDIDGDGRADLFWQHEGNGSVAVWRMDGTRVIEGKLLDAPQVVDPNWLLVGTADVDRNGSRDLVWHHQTAGQIVVWLMNGTSLTTSVATNPAGVPDTNWKIRSVGDVNGDGHADFIWQHVADGRLAVWLMEGLTQLRGVALSPSQVADTNWQIVGPR